MPIEQCRVTAAWKSRGWLADFLYITPHEGEKVKENGQSSNAGAQTKTVRVKLTNKDEQHTIDIFSAAKSKFLHPFDKRFLYIF